MFKFRLSKSRCITTVSNRNAGEKEKTKNQLSDLNAPLLHPSPTTTILPDAWRLPLETHSLCLPSFHIASLFGGGKEGKEPQDDARPSPSILTPPPFFHGFFCSACRMFPCPKDDRRSLFPPSISPGLYWPGLGQQNPTVGELF